MGRTYDRFDDRLLTEQMLRLLGTRQKPVLLALDWTAWQDRFSVLTAAVCIGTRSLPVAVSACGGDASATGDGSAACDAAVDDASTGASLVSKGLASKAAILSSVILVSGRISATARSNAT